MAADACDDSRCREAFGHSEESGGSRTNAVRRELILGARKRTLVPSSSPGQAPQPSPSWWEVMLRPASRDPKEAPDRPREM